MKAPWLAILLLVASPVMSLEWRVSWSPEPPGGWTWDQAWDHSPGFTFLPEEVLVRGYTPEAAWIRVDWKRGPEEGALYFLTRYTSMDHLDLRFRFHSWQDKIWRVGDADSWDPDVPRLIFPVVPWPDEPSGSLLVRLQSANSPVFQAQTLTPSELQDLGILTSLTAGFVLGFLILMLLFNAFMVFTTGERLYLWYSAYVVGMIAFLAVYTGLFQTLFPGLRPLQNTWDVPAIALLIATAQGFAFRANGLGELRPARYLGSLVLLGMAGSLGLQLLSLRTLALQTANVTVLFMIVWVGICLGVFVSRGRRMSRFFVVAWALLLFAGVTVSSSSLALPIPRFDLITGFILLVVAVVLESVILAAALADRFRLIQREIEAHRESQALDERLITLGLLAARVGHEVNTPNHVVLLNASLLEGVHRALVHATRQALEDGGPLGEGWDRALDDLGVRTRAIRSAATHIGQVVAGLGPTRATQALAPCALDEVVTEILRLHEPRWRESARLSLEVEGNFFVILGNPTRLGQLVVNLVNNAVQALTSRDQSVALTLRTDGEAVFLGVVDEGQGMDESTLAKLGTPFFTTKESRGGTGLGWGICQQIVREHLGRLEVTSRPGKGTTVKVRFALGHRVQYNTPHSL